MNERLVTFGLQCQLVELFGAVVKVAVNRQADQVAAAAAARAR